MSLDEDATYSIQLQDVNMVCLMLQKIDSLVITNPSAKQPSTYDADVPALFRDDNKVSCDKDSV